MGLTARKAHGAGREVKLCHASAAHGTSEPPPATEETLLLRGKPHAVVNCYAIDLVLQSKRCSFVVQKICFVPDRPIDLKINRARPTQRTGTKRAGLDQTPVKEFLD
jgi:hypothetical protein